MGAAAIWPGVGWRAFVEPVRQLLEAKLGAKELSWVTPVETGEKRQAAAQALGQRQEEGRWPVWVRVSLGGERRIDIARASGDKDGSAITQILERLERCAQAEPAVRARMTTLKTEHDKRRSRIKSCPPFPTAISPHKSRRL